MLLWECHLLIKMQYEKFIALYRDDPNWTTLRESRYFENDLRRALAGDPSGFRELAIYAPADEVRPQIIRALWKAGVPVRPHRDSIKCEGKLQASLIVKAFGTDLDAFLHDAGFNPARRPNEFDVWRGGNEPIKEMSRGRSWTRSYSVACAFALNVELWRTAQGERYARESGYSEPLVLTRHVRREQAVAWIGGVEREVILTNEAIASPAQPCGSLPDWRRHRARKQAYVAVG